MESRVARIHEHGGPEVLKIETLTLPDPGPGEVVLRHEAAAIAFADTLMCEGTYWLKPPLPTVLGLEGAGVIAAVGPGVEDFSPGDRAAEVPRVSPGPRRTRDRRRLPPARASFPTVPRIRRAGTAARPPLPGDPSRSPRD